MTITDLSPRQRQVLELFAQGYEAVNVAAHLGISEGTVNFHKARLYELTDCHSIVALLNHFYEFTPRRVGADGYTVALRFLRAKSCDVWGVMDELNRAGLSDSQARVVLVDLLDQQKIEFGPDRKLRLMRPR